MFRDKGGGWTGNSKLHQNMIKPQIMIIIIINLKFFLRRSRQFCYLQLTRTKMRYLESYKNLLVLELTKLDGLVGSLHHRTANIRISFAEVVKHKVR